MLYLAIKLPEKKCTIFSLATQIMSICIIMVSNHFIESHKQDTFAQDCQKNFVYKLYITFNIIFIVSLTFSFRFLYDSLVN